MFLIPTKPNQTKPKQTYKTKPKQNNTKSTREQIDPYKQ